jgi:D-alanyl-D-alanine carboxypeptidase
MVNDGLGLADGGIISTAQDLNLFLRALYNGDLLDEDLLEEMFTTVEDDEGGRYGLGIVFGESDYYGFEIGHSGATAGFQSNMVYFPDTDLVVIVLTNDFDSEDVEALTYEAADLFTGE